MNKIQGIYKITNLINGKCYIGKSEDIEYRKKIHFRELEITSTPSDFFERHQYSSNIWTSKTFDLKLFPDVLTNFLLQGG